MQFPTAAVTNANKLNIFLKTIKMYFLQYGGQRSKTKVVAGLWSSWRL